MSFSRCLVDFGALRHVSQAIGHLGPFFRPQIPQTGDGAKLIIPFFGGAEDPQL